MFRLCIFLLAILGLWPRMVCAAPQEELLSRSQLLELYGDPQQALSPAEAEELLLKLTNHEREQAGLGRLMPLELAGYMARRHAADMARQGYSAHFDTEGLNPVERYNRRGGTDHVQENLILLEIEWPLGLTERLVRSFQREWLDSPEHLRTMLSPQATHFGCAFELVDDNGIWRMAAVSEFVSEHGDYGRLPQQLRCGERLVLSGQLRPGTEPGYIGVGLQDSPRPLSIAELNAVAPYYILPQESYQLAIDRELSGELPRPPGAALDPEAAAGTFHLELEIPADWAGRTAYFYIFAWPEGDGELRCVACQAVVMNI